MKKDEGVIVRKVFKVYKDGTIFRNLNGTWEKAKLYKFKPTQRAQERYQTSTYYNGKQYTVGVSRLIAEALIPNPENKKMVFHKDGNSLNDSVDNLEWVTPTERLEKTHAFGKGYMLDNFGEPCTECGDLTLSKSGLCRNCQRLNKIEVNAKNRLNVLNKKYEDIDVNKLNEREKSIILMRKNGNTFEMIGKKLGITRERVRQIEEKITQKHIINKKVEEFKNSKKMTIYDIGIIRKLAGISQYKLANFIGLSSSTYKYKEDKPDNFTVKQLRKISIYLGVEFNIYETED